MAQVLVYVGSAILFAWGIGHLIPTRSVVGGFGALSLDNHRIITREWIAEGPTWCFLGVVGALVVLAGGLEYPLGRVFLRVGAAQLFFMAGSTAAMGAKTSIGPMKACPIVARRRSSRARSSLRFWLGPRARPRHGPAAVDGSTQGERLD